MEKDKARKEDLLLQLARKSYFIKGIFILLVISPLLLMAIFSLIRFYSLSTNLIVDQKRALEKLAVNVLQERLSKFVDLGLAISSRPLLMENIFQSKWSEATAVLDDLTRKFPNIEGFLLANAKGVIKGASSGPTDIIEGNFAYRDWYKGVSRDWKPYVSEVYQRANKPQYNIIGIAIPIKFSDYSGKMVLPKEIIPDDIAGILLFQVRLEIFGEWAKDFDIGKGGLIYIVDQYGQLVWHPNFLSQERIVDYKNIPSVRKILNGESGYDINYNADSKSKYLTIYDLIPDYGWGVVLEQPVSYAFVLRDGSVKSIVFVYLLVIILYFYLAYRLLGSILKRRQAEEKLDRLNLKLEEYIHDLENANKEIDAFSYSVAHDLRSPVRAVNSFTNIILRDHVKDVDPEVIRLLQIIKGNSLNMDQLITDLLTFSHLRSQELRTDNFDLKQLAQETFDSLISFIPEREIDFSVEKLPQEISADKAMIREVISNLISNSLKFTRPREIARIEMGAEQKGEEWAFYIKDNGVGFDMRFAHKLFGVFQRLHRIDEFEGTGVGLSIVQRIINRHGGRVWAEGKVGEGASFHFTLPKII